MIDPLGEHNIEDFLTAFADGELDAAHRLAVIDYLQSHPEACEYLRDRERLRQSAQRVVLADQTANAIPQALKDRLNAIAAGDNLPPSHGLRRLWPRGLGIIAASATIGFAIGTLWSRPSGPALHPQASSPTSSVTSTTVPVSLTAEAVDLRDAAIPPTLVRAAAYVHVDCSRVADRLHSGGYPEDLGPLAKLVETDLRSDAPQPDLTSIGYQFVGAGPCAKPLEGTVHLLYKKTGPEPRATISVFAQAYRGQFGLQPGRMYCIANEESIFPTCAWRSRDVVYFLIADDVSSALSARRAIPSAPVRTGA